MSIIRPATIASDVLGEIRALALSAGHYFSENAPEIRALAAAIDRLQKADAREAFLARAKLYMLCGDVDGAFGQLRKADALGFDRFAIAARAIVQINLGFVSDAQKSVAIAADPTGGYFSSYAPLVVNAGAIRTFEALLCSADKLQLEIDQDFSRKICDAASILAEANITDSEVGKYLDVVGEIMRENKVFYLGDSPDLFVWAKDEANRFIHFTFKLPFDSKTAERLDTDLITRFVDRFGGLPEQLSITIKSGLSSDGRIPTRLSSTGQAARQ